MALRAVLFDFGNVLSGPPNLTARLAMEHILGVSEPEFHRAYWQFRDAYDRGLLNAGPYWNAVANALQRSLSAEQQSSLIAADTDHWTQPNQPMIDWAARVKAAGFKVGLLSNIGDAMEAGVLARCPWLHSFDHWTFSHRLGIAKPDHAIYIHAAAGLGVPPAEILFIDDREENIAGARSAGMIAIQYTEHKLFVADVERLGPEARLPSAATLT